MPPRSSRPWPLEAHYQHLEESEVTWTSMPHWPTPRPFRSGSTPNSVRNRCRLLALMRRSTSSSWVAGSPVCGPHCRPRNGTRTVGSCSSRRTRSGGPPRGAMAGSAQPASPTATTTGRRTCRRRTIGSRSWVGRTSMPSKPPSRSTGWTSSSNALVNSMSPPRTTRSPSCGRPTIRIPVSSSSISRSLRGS